MTIIPSKDAALLAAGFERIRNDAEFGFGAAPGRTAWCALYSNKKWSDNPPKIDGVEYWGSPKRGLVAAYRVPRK